MISRRALSVVLALGFGVPAWGDQAGESAQRIDAALLAHLEKNPRRSVKDWKEVPLVLPQLVDDATFLRRASIDIEGRLPTAEKVRAFTQSTAADKRAVLIDELTRSTDAADWRFQRIADALRVTDMVQARSMARFADWLRKEIREGRPWDELVRRMLLARGDQSSDPATGLLLRDAGDRLVTASALAGVLVGADMHCAQCHDHAFADWTQMQLYQMAACLPPVRGKMPSGMYRAPKTLLPGARPLGTKITPPLDPGERVKPGDPWFGIAERAQDRLPGMRVPNDYKYRDGKPGELVKARFIRFEKLRYGDKAMPTAEPTREQVAEWFTVVQRDRLAAMMAMRVWGWMFGTPGQPADCREGDFDRRELYLLSGTSCSAGLTYTPQIIQRLDTPFAKALAVEFQHCGYDLAAFQRMLGRTMAYQREAIAETDTDRGGNLVREAPVVRRLPAEVLWDALQRWLPGKAVDVSVNLPQVPAIEHPLRLFGRGGREWTDESAALISHGLTRFLCNSDLTQRCSAALGTGASTDDLFLSILGRPPTDADSFAISLSEASPVDAAWALINTTEFLFQH